MSGVSTTPSSSMTTTESTAVSIPVEPKVYKRLDGSHLAECYPDKYDELFQTKIDRLRSLLSLPVEQSIEAFSSPPDHFRMRANFQMWHDNNKDRSNPAEFYYCMFDNEDKNRNLRAMPREIKTFPRASHRINALMGQLMQIFQENKIIYMHLFEVRFLTTKCDRQALVVLCYKSPLHAQWKTEADRIGKQLNIKIVGRARKMKCVANGSNVDVDPEDATPKCDTAAGNVNDDGDDDEFIEERLHILGREYRYFQTEGAFSQPNAIVCEKMITWAMNHSHDHDSEKDDLLELYCGGGTFTAPLSTQFRKVLATEISQASVALATRCFAANALTNIHVAKLSSEEFTSFYTGERVFKRLEDKHIRKEDFNIHTVFVDPPRAGLDAGTCKLISRFEKIVYVSCNPETLARDVKELSKTHDVTNVAAFDQFPYTHHLESGVVMIKKKSLEEPSTGDVELDTSAAKKQRVE